MDWNRRFNTSQESNNHQSSPGHLWRLGVDYEELPKISSALQAACAFCRQYLDTSVKCHGVLLDLLQSYNSVNIIYLV